MIRVYLCSPYRGDVEANVTLARNISSELCRRGCAAFAPHLLYPQFLNDDEGDERALGIQSALAWLPVCDVIWVYRGAHLGEGMIKEIAEAHSLGVPVIEQHHLHDFETPFKEMVKILEERGR